MTDKELLEMAGKALNRRVLFDYQADGFDIGTAKVYLDDEFGVIGIPWNPINDDGDALRLAVKLRIDYKCYGATVRTWVGDPVAQRVIASIEELCGPDPYAATRRAIVRAAAEIGKAM